MYIFEEPPRHATAMYAGEEIDHEGHQPEHEKEQRRSKRVGRFLAKAALGATVATGALTGALQYDIHRGKEAIADSEPSIEHVYNPSGPDYHNSATVILPGFGTKSASAAAERLAAHADSGHVFALEYSNKDIDINELTEVVIAGLDDHIDKDDIKYVNFDGYSMGGVVISAVAANLHENYPDIVVTSVSLNSTPVGESGLSRESSESIEALGSLIDFCNHVKLCAGIEYSPTVHRLTEIGSRYGNYYDSENHAFNLSDFRETISLVDDKLSAPDAPGPTLAYNQASALEGASNQLLRSAQEEFHVNYGIERSIEILSRPSGDKPPVDIFYTMSEDPGQDRVVNVQASSEELQAIANRHGTNLEIVPLSVDHVNIYRYSNEYNEFIADHVNPTVAGTVQMGS